VHILFNKTPTSLSGQINPFTGGYTSSKMKRCLFLFCFAGRGHFRNPSYIYDTQIGMGNRTWETTPYRLPKISGHSTKYRHMHMVFDRNTRIKQGASSIRAFQPPKKPKRSGVITTLWLTIGLRGRDIDKTDQMCSPLNSRRPFVARNKICREKYVLFEQFGRNGSSL
jgi:hypothetical protein